MKNLFLTITGIAMLALTTTSCEKEDVELNSETLSETSFSAKSGEPQTVADLDLSEDALFALGFGSASLGSNEDRINNAVYSISTNRRGIFSLAENGNILFFGTEMTPSELENDILNDFRRVIGRFVTTNVSDVVEEFRPLARYTVNSLLTLLNS